MGSQIMGPVQLASRVRAREHRFMPEAHANGLKLEYEILGQEGDPVVLLVCGVGSQLTSFKQGFCSMLVDSDHRVVRFDNRDAGLSTELQPEADPDFLAILSGDLSTLPYSLSDMAADCVGLLDWLGVEQAHVVGRSMGGMIAQVLAIEHPERVASLASIYSSTGDRSVGRTDRDVATKMVAQTSGTRDQVVAHDVEMKLLTQGPGFLFDEAAARADSENDFDRSYRPGGVRRHAAAVMAAPDRTEALRHLDVATVVIHGDRDLLVDLSGGKATAAAIPNAEFVVIPGMGHDLAPEAWPVVVDALLANFAKGDARLRQGAGS